MAHGLIVRLVSSRSTKTTSSCEGKVSVDTICFLARLLPLGRENRKLSKSALTDLTAIPFFCDLPPTWITAIHKDFYIASPPELLLSGPGKGGPNETCQSTKVAE